MTATPPSPSDTIAQRIDRLASGWWNSDDVADDNQGGMGDDGHVDNFPAALTDVGLVAQRVGQQAAEVAVNTATAIEAAARAEAAAAVASGAAGATLNATGVSGTGDAVTVTVGVSLSAYFDLLTVRLVWPGANTTTAPTLAVTSTAGALAAKPVRDAAGNILAVGALASGTLVTASYITASDHWRLGGGSGTDLSGVHAAIVSFT